MPSRILDSHTSVKFRWKLTDFSKLGAEHRSDVFSVGGLKWRVLVYPKGNSNTYDNLSIFLVPDDATKFPSAEFKFIVTSQTDSKNNVKKSVKHQFARGGSHNGHGWPSFMSLKQLHNHSKGYLRHDTCIIQVVVTCLTSEAVPVAAPTGQESMAGPVVATGPTSKANEVGETSLVNELNAVVFIV